MKPPLLRKVLLAAMIVAGTSATGQAASDTLTVLFEDTWICANQENYQEAVNRSEAPDSPGLRSLDKELREAGKCMLVDGEKIEDMMAPYVEVLEQNGAHVKVRFSVEYYKRVELLHRRFSRVTYAGWTSSDRLRDYYAWLNNE